MMVALLFLPEVDIWSTVLSIVHEYMTFLVRYTDSSSLVLRSLFFWSLKGASFYLYI